MPKDLPVPIGGSKKSLSLPTPTSNSAVTRVAAAMAPELIRVAERVATQQLQQRNQRREIEAKQVNPAEAMHMSEVEIDFSLPFVRKLTMRKATAWTTTPSQAPVTLIQQAPSKPGKGSRRLRQVGMISFGIMALTAGLLARRINPLGLGRKRIIDVTGKTRS